MTRIGPYRSPTSPPLEALPSGSGFRLVMLLHDRGGGQQGRGRAEALVEWAREALERGLDGSALRILAGESRPYDSGEVDELFAAVLAELRLPEPRGVDELTDAVILVVCNALLGGDTTLDAALGAITHALIHAGDPERFYAWTTLTSIPSEEPIFADVPRDARRLAMETIRTVPVPPWLRAYLALDRRSE